jgi:serine protease Do
MNNKFSLKSIVVISFFSVLLGLSLAVKLDWLSTCRAQKDAPPVTYFPDNRTPSSFAELAKRTQPAVVNISTSKTIKLRRVNPFYDDFYENYFQSHPSLRKQNSLGSGFIINKEGYILTNNHVVNGADEIQAKLSDGRVFDAQIVGVDLKTDIAVIKINAKDSLPTVNLGDSDVLDIGDWVIAIGNPFGLSHTVTAGIVSAKGRVIGAGPYDDFIQTDASINPGNSGGPLFNMKGEVVGINTAVIASGQGIGFATPINIAKTVIPQLIKGGQVQRGYLGIGLQELTPELASNLGLNRPEGALVAQVYDGSPAYQAGIQPGDLILSFNGHPIERTQDLPIFVSQSAVGSPADLEVQRGGQKKDIKVKLSSLDQASQQVAESSIGSGVQTKMGVAVRDVSPQEGQQQGIPPGKGVTVTDIARGSTAETVGIQPGDVILQINEQAISNSNDFLKMTQGLQRGQPVRIFVKRGPMTSFFAFKI